MATINRIALSERRLAVQPSVMSYTPRATAQHARDVAALGQQASQAIDQGIRTIHFMKERDAQIMCEKWNAGVLRLLNGSVVKNQDGTETRIPGAAQKTWSDYEKQGTDKSPITDLADYERQFQNSPEFQAMDSITRTKFNRMMEMPRARAMSEANRLYDRNARARDDFYDQVGNANDEERLQLSMYGSDEDFDATLREVATSKTDRKFRRLDRTDPRVESAYQQTLLQETKNAAIGRVAALAADGAAGEAKIIGGEIKSNVGNIERAENYLDSLSSSGRISPEETRALGYKIVQARSLLSRRMQGEIESAAKETVLKLSEPGGVENADKVIAGFKTMAAAKRPGTESPIIGKDVSNTALEVAQKIDQAADKRVQFELMNDLADGKNLFMSDGKTPIFEKGTRQARLFPSVYQTFAEKRQREFNKGFRAAREQNLLAVKGKMMEFAAEGNPQGFYGYIADQVVAKKLTAGDFTRLRDEFNSGWMKGFKGSPDQLARQTSMAKNMLGLLKDRLGVDFSEAVKKDDYGDPVLKNGTIDFDEKKELPSAEVKRQFKKTVRHGDIFFSFGSDIGTRKEEISGEQLKGILGQAMNLWSCDGMKLSYDPVTGEDLPEGQTHTVNAERDFASLLDRVADEKNVLSAAQTLKNQAAYAANVRMQAKVDADRLQKKMTGSTPVTDKALEDKSE